MSLAEIRSEVRKARREREQSLDKLAEASGVERSAIHKIESPQKYPDYEPGLDTFRRIVGGLEMTLTAFFRRVEGATLVLGPEDLAKLAALSAPPAPADLRDLAKGGPRPPAPPTPQGIAATPANAAGARSKRAPNRRR